MFTGPTPVLFHFGWFLVMLAYLCKAKGAQGSLVGIHQALRKPKDVHCKIAAALTVALTLKEKTVICALGPIGSCMPKNICNMLIFLVTVWSEHKQISPSHPIGFGISISSVIVSRSCLLLDNYIYNRNDCVQLFCY